MFSLTWHKLAGHGVDERTIVTVAHVDGLRLAPGLVGLKGRRFHCLDALLAVLLRVPCVVNSH